MTKRDFKTRRNLFKGRMKTAHDFESFRTGYQRHKWQQRAWRIMAVIFVVIVIGLAVYFGFAK
jgi:hypothetical protein